MNRKILFFLSVILSLALVMPLLTINSYAGDENGNYEKYGEAIKTLSRFGMIDGDNFDADENKQGRLCRKRNENYRCRQGVCAL